jgi:hypothetical protein
MKRFRWMTLLLPVVFVLAASTVASASTGPQAPSVPTTLSVPAAVQPLATATNVIINESDGGLGLGVIHEHDNNYVFGKYDAVLPINQSTANAFGWITTAGWYTGPGFCTRQFRSDTGSNPFTRQSPDLPAGQHFIGAHTSYVVEAYPC